MDGRERGECGRGKKDNNNGGVVWRCVGAWVSVGVAGGRRRFIGILMDVQPSP
jgi:hypothetical protein